MNFKLLTFIFVVIGVQSINSSIINKQSIDNLVQIRNLDTEAINVIVGGNPWSNNINMTFNIEDTVVMNGVKYSEVICNNELNDEENDFCTRGDGKYQAKIVKCTNVNNGRCELFNAKVLNKNVYCDGYSIHCLPGFNQENYKGMCRFEYAYETTRLYDEADDVENKDQI